MISSHMSSTTVLTSSLVRGVENGSTHSDCLQEMRHNDSLPKVIRCSSGICARARGEQWHHAFRRFVGRRHHSLLPNVISYNSGHSACNSGEQISYISAVVACENHGKWKPALELLAEMRHNDSRGRVGNDSMHSDCL